MRRASIHALFVRGRDHEGHARSIDAYSDDGSYDDSTDARSHGVPDPRAVSFADRLAERVTDQDANENAERVSYPPSHTRPHGDPYNPPHDRADTGSYFVRFLIVPHKTMVVSCFSLVLALIIAGGIVLSVGMGVGLGVGLRTVTYDNTS